MYFVYVFVEVFTAERLKKLTDGVLLLMLLLLLLQANELEPTLELGHERASLRALQQLADDMVRAYDKADYRRVIFCCDRSLEHAPASRRLKLTKAECLALLGRYAEAEEMAKYSHPNR